MAQVNVSQCLQEIMEGGENIHRNLLLLKNGDNIRTDEQQETIDLTIEAHKSILALISKALNKALNVGEKDD